MCVRSLQDCASFRCLNDLWRRRHSLTCIAVSHACIAAAGVASSRPLAGAHALFATTRKTMQSATPPAPRALQARSPRLVSTPPTSPACMHHRSLTNLEHSSSVTCSALSLGACGIAMTASSASCRIIFSQTSRRQATRCREGVSRLASVAAICSFVPLYLQAPRLPHIPIRRRCRIVTARRT